VVADTGGRPLGVELLGDGRLLVCDARRGLLAVDPETSAVEVLVDRVAGEPMRFCNNAAVAADGTVYFSDSSRRFGIDHWRADLLEHSGTGRLLPGFPDNLSTGADGLIWVALGSPRNPLLDRLHRLHPALRRAVWALPERRRPKPERTLWVLAVDATGAVVHDLQGPGDRYTMVTGMREHGGRLYLGSLAERAVAVLDL